MDADAWAAIAAWSGFAATAGAGYFTYRQARTAREALGETKAARQIASDQATSAREAAVAAGKSADAAVSQAASAREQAASARDAVEIARATYDQADRPTIVPTIGPVDGGTATVTLVMTDGPATVRLTVLWSSSVTPIGPMGQQPEAVEADGPNVENFNLIKNDKVSFEVPCGARPDRIKVRLTMACVDIADANRRWPLTDVVRWKANVVRVLK